MDLRIWAAAEHAIGRPFFFVAGQRVICSGYPGTVKEMYGKGMVDVRLESGEVCVSAAFPECFPDPLDFVWTPEPDMSKLTLFNRTGREFMTLRQKGRKWTADTGEVFGRREDAMRAAEQYACWRIQTEVDERTSRATAYAA
jgi:hypothetical protein